MDLRRNIGLDLKYGLGPAFTLSATINPDFGQVEADPSQVNLGPNELFFAEKRPFFLEGIDLFKLGIGNGDQQIEGQFYSRRIGATPDTDNLDYQYLRTPSVDDDLRRDKLTGKTREGWSLGLFDAVTGGRTPRRSTGVGSRQNPQIAALTNYAVGRVKRDFRDGKTTVGAVGDRCRSRARRLAARWFSTIRRTPAGCSSIIGGPTTRGRSNSTRSELGPRHARRDREHAALNRHLWQRPDAKDVHFDPTLTSMAGYGVTFKAGQMGDTKHWRIGIGGDLRSPG